MLTVLKNKENKYSFIDFVDILLLCFNLPNDKETKVIIDWDKDIFETVIFILWLVG